MEKYIKNVWLWLSLSIIFVVIQFFLNEKTILYSFLTVSVVGLIMSLFKIKRLDEKE